VGEGHGCLENREDEGPFMEKFAEKLAGKGKARELIIR
jgi:hypothetical protein